MPITFAYENSATITATEFSLPNNATYSIASPMTATGVFQAFLDLNAVIAGDQFIFRIYEKARTADTQRILDSWIFTGVQGAPIFASPSLLLGRGWNMTLQRLAGVDRTIPWSIRQVT